MITEAPAATSRRPSIFHHPTMFSCLSARSWLVLWGAFWWLSAAGLPEAARASANHPGIDRIERLSTSQGLSGGRVHAITQDARGFLWLATERGLNVYDGYEFRVYEADTGDSGALSHNHVRTLHVDSPGSLWVGTLAGLHRFEAVENRFEGFWHDPEDSTSLSAPSIESIHRDASGTLWVGTRRGLNRLAADGRGFSRSLEADHVLALHEDRSGHLWIGTAEGRVHRLDLDTGEIRTIRDGGRDQGRIACLLVDRSGALWLGTSDGLESLDATTQQLRRRSLDPIREKEPAVQVVHEAEDGSLWIGTEYEGLFHVDPATGTATRLRHDPQNRSSLSSNRIESIFEDAAGVLWVGTDGGGLNKIVRERRDFEKLRHDPDDPQSLVNSQVRSVYVDRSSVLWVGTEGGLTRLEPGPRAVHYQHDPNNARSLSSSRVWAIAEDRQGRLWFGTQGGGLSRLDGDRRFTHFRHDATAPDSLIHDDVSVLRFDSSGRLWIGTSGGLSRLDPEVQTFVGYSHDPTDPESLTNDRITAIHEGHQGKLWLGTYVGLNRLDPKTGQVRRFLRSRNRPDSLNDNRIWSLYERSPGELWIGTSSGISRLDTQTERFMHLTPGTGSRSDVVYSILGDDQGRLWLGTDRGLSRLDPKTESFVDYGISDGLQAGAFHSGVSYSSTHGELFFGGSNGLNRFYPSSVQEDVVPSITLTAFKKLNRAQMTESLFSTIDQVSLSHEDYFVTFEFAVLDFKRPEENRYEYKLEGFDDEWIDVGTRRSATYTNLPAGQYKFFVRGSNSDGVQTRDDVVVQVHVAPPYWETGWFRFAGVMALAALIFGVHQFKTRSIQQKNRQLERANEQLAEEIARRTKTEEEKQQVIAELEAQNSEMESFAYSVSHDLKSPLVTIESFLGLIEKDIGEGKLDRVQGDMDKIHSATRKMSRLLDELLQLSRVGRLENVPEPIPLAELAHEAAGLAAGRLGEAGAEIEIAADLPVVFGDRQRLLEALLNLIDNAAKFFDSQPTPRVEVGWRRGEDEPVYFVRDNGIGIDARYQEKIFRLFEQLNPQLGGTGIGLAMVQRIIEIHGGRIWVESDGPGTGSTFYFTLADESRSPLAAVQAPSSR